MESIANESRTNKTSTKNAAANYQVSHVATPLMPITYPEAERFTRPVLPTFGVFGSIASILSLMFMSLLSSLMFLALVSSDLNFISQLNSNIWGVTALQQANNLTFSPWVWLPFAFTIFGSVVGWVFELSLLITGHPFQVNRTGFDRFVTQVRLLNLSPVITTIFFFICALSVSNPDVRLALFFMSAAGMCGLGFALFFGSRAPIVQLSLLGIQVLQMLVVWAASAQLENSIITLLIGQSVLQLSMLLMGIATPIKSTVFHVVNTIAGALLFVAVVQVSQANPMFSASVAPDIASGSLMMWGLIATCVIAVIISAKTLPDAYDNFRAMLSNIVWSPLYFKLVSADRFPDPVNLSQVYDKVKPKKTPLIPYYQAHPQHLIQRLSIPAVADKDIEANVTVFKVLVKQALAAFKLIAFLDHNLPQADIRRPLRYKPRMAVWSNGNEYWPNLFSKQIFGANLPNHGKLADTPSAAIAAFKEGQLLAYLAESGVANPFIKPAPHHGAGILMTDFRFLEQYETKADYESYGGVAYFQVNAHTQALELVSLIAPCGTQEISANPHDPEFRRAEALILASMYYQVISGKHLAEIHMTYNLVEVAMHNAFDAKGQWAHPFRTFMYLHFFSHELAEEMTTEHLIQERAVFSQIFATTHDDMIKHLNDTYSNFVYGEDENFEARAAAMTMPNGEILPHACIKWELEYFSIWLAYTTKLIDIIYEDDAQVCQDQNLQEFHHGLLQVMLNGLPERYADFKSKKGVARFAADTIHHCVVRHQVYGTTGIKAALDPRISTTQVPRDTSTPAIDEWRSLAFVALATGEARFTLLTGMEGKDFTYLLDGIEEVYHKPMAAAFNQLQMDLIALNDQWTSTEAERVFNENYFRAVPAELHTGPGY